MLRRVHMPFYHLVGKAGAKTTTVSTVAPLNFLPRMAAAKWRVAEGVQVDVEAFASAVSHRPMME